MLGLGQLGEEHGQVVADLLALHHADHQVERPLGAQHRQTEELAARGGGGGGCVFICFFLSAEKKKE